MKKKPPREVLEEFSRKVRSLMHARGLASNAELARRMEKAFGREIDRQLVHKWVNAESLPGDPNLRVLAEVLMVPVSELNYATAGPRPAPAQLSESRVPFHWKPDPHNPLLVRAEMSDVLTVEQAEKIAAILGMAVKK